jgi:hypothetical protein
MTQPTSPTTSRDRARSALWAGGGVAVVLFVQLLVGTVLSVLSYAGYGALGSPTGTWDPPTLFSPLLGFGNDVVGRVLPFGIGVFLALWLIVPLAAAQGVVRVVVRSVAASAVGALASLLVLTLLGVSSALASAGPWFGDSMPRFDGYSLVLALSSAVQNAALQFVQNTPLVVLAGILVTFLATLGRGEARASRDG